jgi:hypothetical protein
VLSRVLAQHGCVDRGDLALEAFLSPCAGRLLLRRQTERVEILTRDPVVLGDPVCAGELVGEVEGPRLGPGYARSAEDVRAETDAAHHLDPARDADVDRVRGDQPGDEVVGLLG